MPTLIGILVAVAIIYFAYTQYVKTDQGGPNDVGEQMELIDQTQRSAQQPPAAGANQYQPVPSTLQTPTPSPSNTGIRAPIDRTRQVLDTVRQRAQETDQQ